MVSDVLVGEVHTVLVARVKKLQKVTEETNDFIPRGQKPSVDALRSRVRTITCHQGVDEVRQIFVVGRLPERRRRKRCHDAHVIIPTLRLGVRCVPPAPVGRFGAATPGEVNQRLMRAWDRFCRFRFLPVVSVLPVLGLLIAPGCVRTSAGPRRDETERLLRAVDRLIAADRNAKRPPLALLEAIPCADPDTCRLKTNCVDAFRPLVESTTLQEEVRAELARANGTPLSRDRAQALGEKTTRAEGAKRQAEARVGGCLQGTAQAREAMR